jgi:hypothetical protein
MRYYTKFNLDFEIIHFNLILRKHNFHLELGQQIIVSMSLLKNMIAERFAIILAFILDTEPKQFFFLHFTTYRIKYHSVNIRPLIICTKCHAEPFGKQFLSFKCDANPCERHFFFIPNMHSGTQKIPLQ